jgi:hypothetical protein
MVNPPKMIDQPVLDRVEWSTGIKVPNHEIRMKKAADLFSYDSLDLANILSLADTVKAK